MSYQPHRSSLEHSQALAAILSRVGLTALLAFGALHAHAGPLTLDDALRVAQARSRQLPAQDAAAAAARDMAVAAGQRPDPVLKMGVFCLALLVLLVVMGLSVFKPRGMARYGQRKQRALLVT